MDPALKKQAEQRKKVPLSAAKPPLPQSAESLVAIDDQKPIRMGSGIVKRLISTGGMAYIYEIWNPDLEIKRAVKVLKPDHTEESEHRFYTEMKITAKLHHPNIVEIYAVGTWNNLPYIEMEEIDGLTLEQLIEREGALPLEICTSIGIMVGRALNYAHKQSYMIYGKEYRGIIHRDLKPSNIMITRQGTVKLMDFGIAKPTSASIHTSEGLIVGTLQYLSPEQLDGKDIDIRADMYSMGTVLYEMLTGVRAFPESNLAKLVPRKLENSYRPLADFKLKTPKQLRALIARSMHKEKEHRTQNALELLRKLDKIHRRLTPHSPEQVMAIFMQSPHGRKTILGIRKRRSPAPVLAAAAALILITAAMIGIIVAPLKRSDTQKDQRNFNQRLAQRDFPAPDEPASDVRPEASVSRLEPPPPVSSAIPESPPAAAKHSREHDRTDRDLRTKRRSPQDRADVSPYRQRQPVRTGVTARPSATPVRLKAAPRSHAATKPDQEPEFNEQIPRAPENSTVERLKARYASDDMFMIFCSEIEDAHFKNALEIYDQVPKTRENQDKRLIYYLRALRQTGNDAEARRLLAENTAHDGEFLIEKSMYLYEQGNLDGARRAAEKAAVSPSHFMAQRAFRRKLLYTKALIAGAHFQRTAETDARQSAMTAWYDVKSLLRNSPQDPFYVKADKEIRAISQERIEKQ